MLRSNRKRHRPEEVIAKLRQADEALAKGTPIAGVARSLGVSEATLLRWRAEFGAVDRDAVRRMKELEKESARPKRLVPQKRVKRRRIGTGENGIVHRRATRKNEVWGMDFVQDRMADGRPFRMLVVLDECTRECLAIEVHRHLRGEDIVAVPDELTAIRGAPAHIRADNGTEMISKAVKAWCEESGTGALSIDTGSPWQNGIVESFNGRLRDEPLSAEIFCTLSEARYLIDRWRLSYNHRRIQRALGKVTPAAFAATCPALPPLRLAALACPAAPPGTKGAATMNQLS